MPAPAGKGKQAQSSSAPFCPPSTQQPPSCVKKLTSYQYATSQITPDGNTLIQASPHNKNDIPFAAQLAGQRGQVSLTLKANAHVRHPSGSQLFPQNSDLSGAFDNLLTTLQSAGSTTQTAPAQGKTPAQTAQLSVFVPLFRKLQFMILNDLYIYLTSIYSTFSMTHYASAQEAAINEPITALNKKSLMVDHLLNVVQDQMYFICSHHQPLVPQHLGLKTGALMLQHDKTVDPLFLLKDFTQPLIPGDLATSAQQQAHTELQTLQSTYLNAIKTAITFFKTYTSYLTKPDTTTKIPGSNAFIPLAQHINQIIQADPYTQGIKKIIAMKNDSMALNKFISPTNATSMSGASSHLASLGVNLQNASSALPNSAKKISALRNLKSTVKPINPPFFSYNKETLRALKVIPQTASALPKGVKAVQWPSTLVTAAQKGTMAMTASGDPLHYQVAYFQTATGTRTTNKTQAAKLFINLPTPNGPFAQEIKKQPTWLNSPAGIIEILSGCLGDYSQLVGKGILESCTEAILCKALGISCPASASATTLSCEQQLAAINRTQQQYIANMTGTQAPQQTTPATTQPQEPSYTQKAGSYLPGGQQSTESGTTGSQPGAGSQNGTTSAPATTQSPTQTTGPGLSSYGSELQGYLAGGATTNQGQ